MQVTFLGTGTSTGVPVIGCTCATCQSTDPKDKRSRPSIYLQFDDGSSVLVDASPDLRAQALQYGIDRVDLILLTHSHADHVLGLDDVRIFNFRQRTAIPCQGDARTLSDVRRMFAYVFDPATGDRTGSFSKFPDQAASHAGCVKIPTRCPLGMASGCSSG